MVTIEIYIAKVNGFSEYKIKNVIGTGLASISKVLDFTPSSLSSAVSGATNGLSILVNGVELKNNIDYYIDVNNNMLLVNPLNVGDKLEIHDTISGEHPIVTKNSYNPNALVKLFSADQKFKYNQEYSFSLSIEDEGEVKTFTQTFQSQYDPYYSNIKNIRLDTGDLLDGVTDAQIAKLVYKWSKDAYTILDDDNRLEEITTYKYVQNYVRYKADIDLCYAIYVTISGKYGTIIKEIGNVKVQREIKLPYIEQMIARFRELLKPNEELLLGDDSMVVSFVKGSATEYPVSDRGVF